MQECVQRVAAKHGIHYPSKSNPNGKGYKAYAYRDDDMPMCTCMPFLRGRKKKAEQEGLHPNEVAFHCGHLDDLYATGCDWRQKTDADYQMDNICPQCGSPVIDDGDIIDISDEAAIASLLQMARDLDPENDTAEQELAPTPSGGQYRDIAADLIRQAKGTAA